jgi:hypothetical protein
MTNKISLVVKKTLAEPAPTSPFPLHAAFSRENVAYTYDTLHRVKTETSANREQTYAYDKVGNRSYLNSPSSVVRHN